MNLPRQELRQGGLFDHPPLIKHVCLSIILTSVRPCESVQLLLQKNLSQIPRAFASRLSILVSVNTLHVAQLSQLLSSTIVSYKML